MPLKKSNIVLGVTGGIAAYKAPEIVRRLSDKGARVRVVMTESACDFVKPLVFQAVSGNPVGVDLLDDCLLYTSPSPRDRTRSRMPSSA